MTSTFIRSAKAVSAERYNAMLNILPPLNWCGIGSSTESFRMSEMLDIDTVVIFCRIALRLPTAPPLCRPKRCRHERHGIWCDAGALSRRRNDSRYLRSRHSYAEHVTVSVEVSRLRQPPRANPFTSLVHRVCRRQL